ncbi:hypothetical protein K466DRAFT_496149 [Polyporus arcularius HHB13444]|uniref:Uncharacterized protein n=1 Tax=Polyporus arcularius HHB13444 TaxID=1314778 RepID=A0A5C3P6Z4_9APHY|nr:hypothetical protein K466DRAFT_496149 [Polyporus arcularius HHB13444]
MTVNILVSFSLLALVVTARPISDAPQTVRRSLEVQNAIQAIFASRTGEAPDCLACEDSDIHVSLTTSEEQSALLSSLEDLDAVKAVIPLNVDGSPTQDEKQLYEILKNLESTGSLEDIDGDVLPVSDDSASVAATEAVSEDAASPDDPSQELPAVTFADLYSSPPVIVIAVSCIAALFAVFCVAAGLYAYNHAANFMIKSGLAWDVLPRLEKRVGLDMSRDDEDGGNVPLPEKRRICYDAPLPPVYIFDEKSSEELNEKLVDIDSDDDNVDTEKFHDAPERSLLFQDPDLPPQYEPRPDVPRIVVDEHADPDLLPLPDLHSNQSTPFATPLRTPMRSPLASPTPSPARRVPQMREVQSSPTLSRKPSWSLRAADAPQLGLGGTPSPPRSDSPAPMLPGALFSDDALEVEMQEVRRPRQRTPRQPLDIAFALQLRPGLGLGADSAWLVRFLMAMFGWMTFLVGGNAPVSEDSRRALTSSY